MYYPCPLREKLFAVDQRTMEEYGHWLVSLEVFFFSDNKLQVISLGPKVLELIQKMFRGIEAEALCLISSRITKEVNREK